MPELPEVENLRLGLEKNILGQKIVHVKVNKPKLVSGKGTLRAASTNKVSEFEKNLKNEVFLKINRRAKNLIFTMNSGKIILVHLKMSGQFVYKNQENKKAEKTTVIGGHPIELSEKTLPNKHTHVVFKMEKGILYYNDTRMFGYLLYYPSLKVFESGNHFSLLGEEPLDKNFTKKYFAGSLKQNKGKIKSVLMGQKVVTGLGNIYADESLFEAKIHPEKSASTLTSKEIEKLYEAIKRILKRAVKVGGSSVATYRLLDQSRGNYAREHKVYGKGGKNCPRCGTKLSKIVVQSRTTVFCPYCQKM